MLERYQDVDDGWQALHGLILELYSTVPVGPTMGTPAQDRLDTSPSLRSVVGEIRDALDRLLRLAQSQGAARTDVDLEDLGLILESLRPIVAASEKVAPELWRRHLVLVLDALRVEAATPLPPRVGDAEQRSRLMRKTHG